MRCGRTMIVFLAVLLFSSVRVFAFTMEPMTANLSPTGEGSIATFRVVNDGTERIALRFRVLSRSVDSDGKEVNAAADDAFAVYPARSLVEPGASATVKIQWRGPASIDRESCYRFVAEEVPIDAGLRTESGLRVLFRYIASVYVGLPSFEAKLEAVVRPAVNASGAKGYAIEIANRGTRHVVANGVSIDLALAGGGITALTPSALGRLNGANYLPGCALSAFVPAKSPVPEGGYEARLKYESEY